MHADFLEEAAGGCVEVTDSVLAVFRASRRRRAAAGLLAALGVAGCVAALGIVLAEPGDAWLRGAVAGLLAAACVMATGSGVEAAARRLDRVAGARGEILTAWDLACGQGAGGGSWRGALLERAAQRASGADRSQAVPGVPAALYAAPLAGVVSLAAVLGGAPLDNSAPAAGQPGAAVATDTWGLEDADPDGVLATAVAHAATQPAARPDADVAGDAGRDDEAAAGGPGIPRLPAAAESADPAGRGRAVWVAPHMEGVVERYFNARGTDR